MLIPTFSPWRAVATVAAVLTLSTTPAEADITPFMQGVAETAASNPAIAAFYRETGYEEIWTGNDADDQARRRALLAAFQDAPSHALPAARHDPEILIALLSNVEGERARGRIEVELTKLFLDYARDIQTGILTPSDIDEGMVREVPLRDPAQTLTDFTGADPDAFIETLPPQTPEYARLMKEKMRLERLLARGGWGPEVRARKIEPGQNGDEVVALRNRLIAMGYLTRTARTVYDAAMMAAVKNFQADHGLEADGVAGPTTLSAINVSVESRLSSIIVAMERERWINRPLGDRHIWVNLTDFHVRIVDDGKTSFMTRSVVGMDDQHRRSPEFSDEMDHLVVNPTWNVPRSIATREYLPRLQRNPYAVGHLTLVNRRGQVVPRDIVDFTQFNSRNFPFDMKQRPSRSNALGLVKFMFPNRYNIYLHDTPAKELFGREKRDFSHGCIRLHQPFEFAYMLLGAQTDDPEQVFHSALDTGRETRIELIDPVPVHIVYRTAFTQARGRVQYRGDVYDRDARIFRALRNAGVAIGDLRG